MRGAAGQVAGLVSVAASGGLAIAGRLAMASGAQQVYTGTVSLDIFFGVRAASSSLVEGGIASIVAGQQTISSGAAVATVGGYALAALPVGVLAYFAASAAICAINPEY